MVELNVVEHWYWYGFRFNCYRVGTCRASIGFEYAEGVRAEAGAQVSSWVVGRPCWQRFLRIELKVQLMFTSRTPGRITVTVWKGVLFVVRILLDASLFVVWQPAQEPAGARTVSMPALFSGPLCRNLSQTETSKTLHVLRVKEKCDFCCQCVTSHW